MRAFKPIRTKKRRNSSRPPYEESCSQPNWMERSRLITRRNRATVNRIFGAFRVRWSHFAVLSKRRATGPFSSIISFNRPEIYFASRLTPAREIAHGHAFPSVYSPFPFWEGGKGVRPEVENQISLSGWPGKIATIRYDFPGRRERERLGRHRLTYPPRPLSFQERGNRKRRVCRPP